ncbi:unnamed protein product [Boreogadus saida]
MVRPIWSFLRRPLERRVHGDPSSTAPSGPEPACPTRGLSARDKREHGRLRRQRSPSWIPQQQEVPHMLQSPRYGPQQPQQQQPSKCEPRQQQEPPHYQQKPPSYQQPPSYKQQPPTYSSSIHIYQPAA